MLAGVEKELSMYHVMAWLGGIVVGSVVHLRRKTKLYVLTVIDLSTW